MMTYIDEMELTENVHDGRCPICGTAHIEFVKDIGIFPVHMMYEGKLCQRVKKSLWMCEECMRLFTSNKFFTL